MPLIVAPVFSPPSGSPSLTFVFSDFDSHATIPAPEMHLMQTRNHGTLFLHFSDGKCKTRFAFTPHTSLEKRRNNRPWCVRKTAIEKDYGKGLYTHLYMIPP